MILIVRECAVGGYSVFAYNSSAELNIALWDLLGSVTPWPRRRKSTDLIVVCHDAIPVSIKHKQQLPSWLVNKAIGSEPVVPHHRRISRTKKMILVRKDSVITVGELTIRWDGFRLADLNGHAQQSADSPLVILIEQLD